MFSEQVGTVVQEIYEGMKERPFWTCQLKPSNGSAHGDGAVQPTHRRRLPFTNLAPLPIRLTAYMTSCQSINDQQAVRADDSRDH